MATKQSEYSEPKDAPAQTPAPAADDGPPYELGKGSKPDPELPVNARSSWDKTVKQGPHAVSPINPRAGG